LHKELKPLGIDVIVVEPSGFRTDFAGRSLAQAVTPIADYADTAGKRRRQPGTTERPQAGDPAKAAAAIISAVEAEKPPFVLLLGAASVTGFEKVSNELAADVATWRLTSIGADFSAE
ncbi:MAG: short-chain dehydrogenase/reductase, partial [Actinomycetota bacterium]